MKKIILKDLCKVVIHNGRNAVILNETYFFVDQPVGTIGMFIAHFADQFAYLAKNK